MVNKFWDEGEWVGIPDGPFVNWAVVLYCAKVPIFLFDEEESAFVGALRRADCSSREVFLDELLEYF